MTGPLTGCRKKSKITKIFESILRGRVGYLGGKNSKLIGKLNNYKIVPKGIYLSVILVLFNSAVVYEAACFMTK